MIASYSDNLKQDRQGEFWNLLILQKLKEGKIDKFS